MMNRGRALLLVQLMNARHRHQLPALGPPPDWLTAEEVRAWHDVVAAAPDVLRFTDGPGVALTASSLAKWRAGDRAGLLRELYRELGKCFVPMPKRRQLLFPERTSRP
jgi:hypothetical protein